MSISVAAKMMIGQCTRGTNSPFTTTDRGIVLEQLKLLGEEVREAVRYLTGEYRNPRIHEVTLALCAEMLISAGLASDEHDARAKLQAVLDNGKGISHAKAEILYNALRNGV